MITVTDKAAEKIKDLYIDENDPKILGLRIFVQGGGCSGFQYGFTWDSEQNEDDFIVEHDEIKVIVDSMSMQYLNEATIDYKEELMGSQFVIQNPNVTHTCGCGSSFGV
jgi:iron-sulfur cluster insertion protein